MTPDELATNLKGCNVIISCDSVSHLASHNCLLVNDTFLLSYREAEAIYRRSKAASTIAGWLQGQAERVVGWTLQLIYRACFKTQPPVKMEKPSGEANASVPTVTQGSAEGQGSTQGDQSLHGRP